MNFSERGSEIISCSSLPRLAECPGSFLLSKNCTDTETEDGKAGDIVHWLVSFFAVGGERAQADKYQITNPDLWDQARTMWSHAKREAEDFFGTKDGIQWRSEEREWLLDDDLNPILSGQADLIATHHSVEAVILFDLKSGFLAGDVPEAQCNWQIKGMAATLEAKSNALIYGSVVREWAAETPMPIATKDVYPLLDKVYASTEAGDAGLKTGPHCRWCPANLNGKCPIKRDQLSLVLKQDVSLSMQELPDEGLVRILKAKKAAEQVLEAAVDEARRRRSEGREVAGCSWEAGSVRRNIKDVDGLMAAVGVPVPSRVDVKLSDVEGAWLKSKGLKASRENKDKFTNSFAPYLELKRDKESLVV